VNVDEGFSAEDTVVGELDQEEAGRKVARAFDLVSETGQPIAYFASYQVRSFGHLMAVIVEPDPHWALTQPLSNPASSPFDQRRSPKIVTTRIRMRQTTREPVREGFGEGSGEWWERVATQDRAMMGFEARHPVGWAGHR